MEIIPFIVSVVMFVLVVYWSAANATAEKGQPSFGLFRYPESTAGAAAAEQERRRQGRAFQPQQPAPGPPARPIAGAPARQTRPAARPRPGAPDPAPRPPRR